MSKKVPDLNDKLLAGTLPADPFEGAIRMNERAREDMAKTKKPMDLNDKAMAGVLPADLKDGATPLNDRAKADDARRELPVVWLKNRPGQPFRKLPEVVADCERVIADDPNVFCRDSKLVDVGPVETYQPKAEAKRPQIPAVGIRDLPVTEVRRRVALRSSCKTWRYNRTAKEHEPVEADPPLDVIRTLSDMGRWSHVRPVLGIASAPMLRPDGTVHQCAGWDSETGYVLWPTIAFPRVPSQPTLEEARQAYEQLRNVFAAPGDGFDGFPFISAEDALVPIAALLTLLARPAIEGPTPAFLFDATTPGTGKTLVADLVCEIAIGSEMPKCTFPDKPEELEKMLASMALAGAQVCGFDNLDPSLALRGAPLDKVLSGRDVQFRVLGQSMMPILRWNGVVIATGNNAQVLGDTVRRTLRSRQEPTVEKPEERTGFRIPDIRGHVRKHRAELVVAGLTILRAYVVAGRPKSNAKPWGSYEQWQSIVGSALEWLTGLDVTLCRVSMSEDGEDPEREAAAALVAELARIGGGYTAGRLIALGFGEPSTSWNGTPTFTTPEAPELGEAIGTLTPHRGRDGRPSAKSLGKALTRLKGRVFGDLKLSHRPSATGGGKAKDWFAAKVETATPTGVTGVKGVFSSPYAGEFFEDSLHVPTGGRKNTPDTAVTPTGATRASQPAFSARNSEVAS